MIDKIKGSILAAAVGDALGAPTELRNKRQILDCFGGKVTGFKRSPDDTFARGRVPGQVTDDFSMMYYLMKALIEYGGIVNSESMSHSVRMWGDDELFYDAFAGPTTRAAVESIRKGLPTDVDPYGLVNYNSKATNGSAMKVAPLALLSKGNKYLAIRYAYELSQITHNNSLAISGAAAVSCAISEAINTNDMNMIFEAAITGAKTGEEIGIDSNHISVGASVYARTVKAIDIAMRNSDIEKTMYELSDLIGNTWSVTESVPAAFGIIAAVNGDTMKGMIEAVNYGGDTDTIASMVGAILGCRNGLKSVDSSLVKVLIDVNDTLEITNVLDEFARLCLGTV